MTREGDQRRSEVLTAARSLSLGAAEFSPVEAGDEEALLRTLENRFVETPGRTWWWEAFLEAQESHHFLDGRGYAFLPEIAPVADERAWLVVEADQGFAVFDTTAAAAQRIIGECSAFEYYLVAKDHSWLVCENHHDVVVALGRARERLVAVSHRLKALSSQLSRIRSHIEERGIALNPPVTSEEVAAFENRHGIIWVRLHGDDAKLT